jgi:hypothetical protein
MEAGCFANSEMENAFNSGKARIVIYGKLSYVDEMGVRHWQQICGSKGRSAWAAGEMHPVSSEGYVPECISYNQTDTNRLIQKPTKLPHEMLLPEIPCPVK